MGEAIGEDHLPQRTGEEQPARARDSLPEQPQRCRKEGVDRVSHAADVAGVQVISLEEVVGVCQVDDFVRPQTTGEKQEPDQGGKD